MRTASHLSRGYAIALASAVIFSTTAIFISHLTKTYQLPALVLAFWRDLFVAATLLPILALLRPAWLRVARPHWPHLLLHGLILATFNSIWTISVTLNGAAVSTVLAYSSAGFTALLGWWLLREQLNGIKLLAVAVSLAGCVLVSGALDPEAWRGNLMAIFTGIVSGLLYAGYTLMGRAAAQRGQNPWSTLLYSFSAATVFLLAFNLALGRVLPGAAQTPADLLWLQNRWAGWAILFLLAAGPSLVGFGLYNVSLLYLQSGAANLILTLEPGFTAAIAYVLLGERYTWEQIGGSLLIVSGVVFLRIGDERVSNRAKTQS